MLVIKPYGRTVVTANNLAERQIQSKQQEEAVATFLPQQPEFLIAQWISVLDKIARKPSQQKQPEAKPSPLQYALRECLGQAFWQCLKPLLGIDSDKYHALWRSKVHPYGTQTAASNKDDATQAKGRWYARFVGDIEPDQVDAVTADAVADKVYAHLCKQEYRLGENSPLKQQGKIANLTQSIADNTLQRDEQPAHTQTTWSDQDWEKYNQFDIAKQIHLKAERRLKQWQEPRKNKQPLKPEWRIDATLAGSLLFEHWARVFKTPADGKPMSIAVAREQQPALFAIHTAVKAFYARVFDSKRKPETLVKHLLPQNRKQLHDKLQQQQGNQDINQIIRLGKVLYYRAASGEQGDLADSYYWSSAGQAEIKRAEAFVRVWRGALTQANLALANWASTPQKPFTGDSFDSRFFKHIEQLATAQADVADNTALLFGAQAELFQGDVFAALQLAHKGGSALRHAVLHFKGLGAFVQELQQALP